MPDILQWPLPVPAELPFAKGELERESAQSYQQADRVAAVRGKVETEGEIDGGTDDGLRDVVCQAHPPIITQAADGAPEGFALI